MKKIIKSAISHPLISGSTIIFFGSMAASVLSYLFNLGTGRFLSPSDYGTLIALISMFNIFSVFATTINTVFTKFTAAFVGQKKEEFIGTLFIKGTLLVGLLAFFICGIVVLFSSLVANFLHINSAILVQITALSLFVSYLSYIGNGILQGLLKFGYFSFINIFSSLTKLIFGFLFIFLGFRVLGAVTGILLSALVGYFLIFFPLSQFFKNKNRSLVIPNLPRKISLYALPVFLSSIGITSFISMDIILVKHFFDPGIAGQYAAISITGRAIFYAVSPIAFVLFPLVAQKHEKKEKLTGLLLLALGLVGIPSMLLSFFYFVFPDIVRTIFFPGSQYKFLVPFLGPFSVFILLYTLSFVLNTFYLSIGKIKVCVFTILGALLEIVLLSFFHKDLMHVIMSLIVSSFLLLVSLVLYYPLATKSKL